MNEQLIKANQISIKYGDLYAVKDVSFNIHQGEFIALIGPNGSGKTSLIRGLLNLLPITNGNYDYHDTLKIGYLPQNLKSIQVMFPAHVQEIVKTGLLFSKKKYKRYNQTDHALVLETLKLLEVGHLANRNISKLSGGQQQRVLLARAMVSKPDVLILDEPTSALDPDMRTKFFKLIQSLNQNGTTILMVTHDISHAYDFVNRIIVLDQTIKFDGTCEDFCKNSNLSPFFHHHKEEKHV